MRRLHMHFSHFLHAHGCILSNIVLAWSDGKFKKSLCKAEHQHFLKLWAVTAQNYCFQQDIFSYSYCMLNEECISWLRSVWDYASLRDQRSNYAAQTCKTACISSAAFLKFACCIHSILCDRSLKFTPC